jgi:hypothetical protein
MFLPNIFFQIVVPPIPNFKEIARRNSLALQLASGAHHHHQLGGLVLGPQDAVGVSHHQKELLVDQLISVAHPVQLGDIVLDTPDDVVKSGHQHQDLLMDKLPGVAPTDHLVDPSASLQHQRARVVQLGQPQVPQQVGCRVPLPGGSGESGLDTLLRQDGPLGVQGELLSAEDLIHRQDTVLHQFAWSALSDSTAKQYRSSWNNFNKYGKFFDVDVNLFTFNYQFICQYFVFRLHMSHSVASVLSSRSALTFYYNLYSSNPQDCPLKHPFVTTFLKGMERKF